jgi:phage terminase large subunit-like protein
VSEEDFASKLIRTPEPEFRTKRCNQWVNSVNGWFPGGVWETLADAGREIPDGTDVVLAFDGSISGDSTIIDVITVEEHPHVSLVQAWEKPADQPEWRVPRGEVKDVIRDCCRRWNVREIAWDEFLWLDTAEELEDEGLPIVTFPQQISHMGPATQRFFEAVMDAQITHDGDPVLARHIANATLKTDSRGSRIVKDHRGSSRKIDAAVGAVMGLHRAAELYGEEDGVILW